MKDEKIKQLEQMQNILMETVQNKTNEIEILKQQNQAINVKKFRRADRNDPVVNQTTSQSINISEQSKEYKDLKLNLIEKNIIKESFVMLKRYSIEDF